MLKSIYRERVNFTESQNLKFKFIFLHVPKCFHVLPIYISDISLKHGLFIQNMLKVQFSPKTFMKFFESRVFAVGRLSYTKHEYFFI